MKIEVRSVRAFTLIEVILAIVIASGLLIVAISFYQRSADLRGQLLEESEKLATIRLIMDRLSGDLRTAFAEPRQGFTGGADYLRFVHAGSPSPANLGDGALKLVRYSSVTNAEGTNTVMVGFNRVESPLLETRIVATNREPFSFNGAMDPLANATNKFVEPLTRAIRFVRFRYFDGSEWLDAWDGVDLPVGVEATFGTDSASSDESQEEGYAGEQFRRVIFVPAGRASAFWEELP